MENGGEQSHRCYDVNHGGAQKYFQSNWRSPFRKASNISATLLTSTAAVLSDSIRQSCQILPILASAAIGAATNEAAAGQICQCIVGAMQE
ncbi:MAG: hypothetical protein M3N35_11225 [Candidatus Binatota bacterium]|nr:hypothetical protein [Candidatus Binatota bacterium]